jgi:hypothetical protein
MKSTNGLIRRIGRYSIHDLNVYKPLQLQHWRGKLEFGQWIVWLSYFILPCLLRTRRSTFTHTNDPWFWHTVIPPVTLQVPQLLHLLWEGNREGHHETKNAVLAEHPKGHKSSHRINVSIRPQRRQRCKSRITDVWTDCVELNGCVCVKPNLTSRSQFWLCQLRSRGQGNPLPIMSLKCQKQVPKGNPHHITISSTVYNLGGNPFVAKSRIYLIRIPSPKSVIFRELVEIVY